MLYVLIMKIKLLKLVGDNHPIHKRILDSIDQERREIVLRMKNPESRACAEGAGLLLQLAALGGLSFGISNVTPEEALKQIEQPLELAYNKNEHGKPSFRDQSLPFFNLSHSGDYVVLAVSDKAVGIDIQLKKSGREKEMSEHFFSEKEKNLVRCQPSFFYRLWARKEAYGKCLGEGVRPFLPEDFSDLGVWGDFKWVEKEFDDYYLTVCSEN